MPKEQCLTKVSGKLHRRKRPKKLHTKNYETCRMKCYCLSHASPMCKHEKYNLHFFVLSSYALMFSCWLLSPKDRPSFESLCCELEKALEDLPDAQDPDEILYVNMDESSMELGAVGGRDPIGGPSPLCLKGLDSVTTVEVHRPNRYVLCPQHETNRALSDSMESLDMPVSSSTATLPLQPSCHSTPNPTPAQTPTVELLEDREGSRKTHWQ